MLGLEPLQLVHERVELEIRDLGGVFNVVFVVMVVEQLAQLFDPFAYHKIKV